MTEPWVGPSRHGAIGRYAMCRLSMSAASHRWRAAIATASVSTMSIEQYYANLAEDIYDANMELWKVVWVGLASTTLDNYGSQMGSCGIQETYWDVQNDHVSYVTSFNPAGACELWDKQVPKQFDDVVRYSTPAGLSMILR